MENLNDAQFEAMHRLIGTDLGDWENDRPEPTKAAGLTWYDDPNFDDTFPVDPVSTDDPNYMG